MLRLRHAARHTTGWISVLDTGSTFVIGLNSREKYLKF